MCLSEKIKHAKPEEMSDIIFAVQKRYGELFPEWELFLYVLEKAVDKNEQLDAMIALLERIKDR